MQRFVSFFRDKFYIELGVATILFIMAISLDMLMEFIIYMLYFIIFLEIVRAVINYIREQRVVLTILVDAFIILTLREFVVNVVKVNKEKLDSLDAVLSSAISFNLIILSAVILFLLVVRYFSIKTSQKYILKDKNNDVKL